MYSMINQKAYNQSIRFQQILESQTIRARERDEYIEEEDLPFSLIGFASYYDKTNKEDLSKHQTSFRIVLGLVFVGE